MPFLLTGISPRRTNFADEKDAVIEIDIAVPKVKSEGKYRVQGKFLGSDLFTRGSFELTMREYALCPPSPVWAPENAIVTPSPSFQ